MGAGVRISQSETYRLPTVINPFETTMTPARSR
jgi:hypothetical protein